MEFGGLFGFDSSYAKEQATLTWSPDTCKSKINRWER